jgi:hypothetical protein
MPDLLDLRSEPSNGLRPAEVDDTYEMDDSVGDITRSSPSQVGGTGADGSAGPALPSAETKVQGGVIKGMARHTLGLCLLLCVVFLWTLSNFLGSVCLAQTP